MRLCAYEECTFGPDGGRAVIADEDDVRKRFCMSKHRTAQFKIEQARAKQQGMPGVMLRNAALKRAPKPSGMTVSYQKAVKACERALLDGLMNGQPSESTIPRVAREFMSAALPEKQRRRLEAGR